MKLKALKAVKITPRLILYFIQLPFKKIEAPCRYCPGICLSACPTFIDTGNLNLSPLGYSRDEELGKNKCLKCWRCVSECPLNYPLPETLGEEVKLEVEVLKRGKITLLSAEGLDDKYSYELSDLLGAGLISVSGLTERYNEGRPVNPESLKKVSRILEKIGNVYAISPESSHTLSIPLLIEKLNEFPVRLNYTSPVHIPCLLLDRAEEIIQALNTIGIKPTEIIRDQCLKQKKPEGLVLCPRASLEGLKTIYDEIISSLRS